MKIIDAHLHVSEIEKSSGGVGERINFPTLAGLKEEMRKNGIVGGVLISGDTDVMRCLEKLKRISAANKNMKCVFGVNPGLVSRKCFENLERAIEEERIHGIKIYPAYLPYYPQDKIYSKFYRLAIKHDIPAIIHTGAVICTTKGVKQKYAHPLHVDDLAVDFPRLRILIAHAGYPWIIDAAQVAYKNDNVFLDFSGLKEETVKKNTVLDQQIEWAFHYIDNHEKVIYGSDWPIIRMHEYIAWIKALVPKEMHSMFFYRNAKKFFGFKT
jgi:predicted TIM-barrel fold metal-dependent hydrolase